MLARILNSFEFGIGCVVVVIAGRAFVSPFLGTRVASFPALSHVLVIFMLGGAAYYLWNRTKDVEVGILWRSRSTVNMLGLEVSIWSFIVIVSGLTVGLLWWFLAS